MRAYAIANTTVPNQTYASHSQLSEFNQLILIAARVTSVVLATMSFIGLMATELPLFLVATAAFTCIAIWTFTLDLYSESHSPRTPPQRPRAHLTMAPLPVYPQ